MAMTCTVCRHPKRGEIDLEIVSRAPMRAIARQYGLSKDALRRHRENHMPRLLSQAEQAEGERGLSVRARVEQLIAEARRLMDKAESEGQLSVAIRALGEARAAVGLLADMEFEGYIAQLEKRLEGFGR